MTPFTEENINDWARANPRFVEDQHNINLIIFYVNYMKEKGRQAELSVESMSKYVEMNAEQFHWLRDTAEIQTAAKAAAVAEAARIAALPPEPPQPEKLKGLTPAERLSNVGVQATSRVNHADRSAEVTFANAAAKARQEAAQIKADSDRRKAIEAARNTVIYRPSGRVDYAGTADTRRRALAALGINE